MGTSASPNPNPQFPVLGIALLCILATALLLVIYYLILIKCCFNWQQIDPLRRFSFSRSQAVIPVSPPSTWQSIGLDETFIRKIPTLKYTEAEGEHRSLYECAVCLTEFIEPDLLRILPNCGHGFHLDCVDIWLQTNANCPLCRSTILTQNQPPKDKLVAPTPSPNDEDYVIIELGEDRRSKKQRKCRHGSMMGDERIDLREKEERSRANGIRRSFSMDTMADRSVYLAVQREVREMGERNRGEGSSGSSRRVRRLFFGQGRSSILPVEF